MEKESGEIQFLLGGGSVLKQYYWQPQIAAKVDLTIVAENKYARKWNSYTLSVPKVCCVSELLLGWHFYIIIL